MDSKLTQQRLIQHEKERCFSAKNGGDVLFFNFREDIFAQAKQRFSDLKISEQKLERWQRDYPFIYPWNTQYEVYKVNVNRKFVVYPLIIAMCESDKHVKKAFKIAKKYKLHFAVRSGSHCFESHSLSEGILIDQSRRKAFHIDTEDEILTVEPGVLIGPTIYELSKVGYILQSGSCNNVSYTGLSLGGGIGSLTRTFGMTSDDIISVNILLANGKIVRVDKHVPDLFFALRGAGNGNFGIVTSIEFKIHHAPKLIYFQFDYDFKYIKKVIQIWQHWIPFTDINMNSELRSSNKGGFIKVNGIHYLIALFSSFSLSYNSSR